VRCQHRAWHLIHLLAAVARAVVARRLRTAAGFWSTVAFGRERARNPLRRARCKDGVLVLTLYLLHICLHRIAGSSHSPASTPSGKRTLSKLSRNNTSGPKDADAGSTARSTSTTAAQSNANAVAAANASSTIDPLSQVRSFPLFFFPSPFFLTRPIPIFSLLAVGISTPHEFRCLVRRVFFP